MKKTIPLFLLAVITLTAPGQTVFQHISSSGIYNFLDELQVTGIVDIRSVVKPYSRIFIAQQLNAALQKKEELSKRQSDELEFYLLE
ncbi:MAG: hypothetical protein JXA03_00380, partial [Bacteroidales bacterium]|nr:hypothetical protein [Bacteroidales bacterium]